MIKKYLTQNEQIFVDTLAELKEKGFVWQGGREIAGENATEAEFNYDMNNFYEFGENTVLEADYKTKTVSYGENNKQIVSEL